MSVVRRDALEDCWRKHISPITGIQNAVAANGFPLEVVGNVVIPVSLGQFKADQEFTVVERLLVGCILGSDFLVKHGAVIDCKVGTLALGEHPRLVLPIFTAQSGSTLVTLDDMIVSLPETLETPAHSVMLIIAHLDGVCKQEDFVEPLTATRTGLPKTFSSPGP